MPADPARLLRALSEAMGSIDFGPGELEQRLDELVAVAAAIFEVGGAGLMLLDERAQLRLVGASDEAGAALEAVQQHADAGPGIDATRRGELVAVSDLSQDGRWPQVNRAVQPFGVVSVLSAPICVGGRGVGNLNLYDRVAREWTPNERAGITAFARVASALLRIALAAHHGDRLVTALSQRWSAVRAERDDR